MPPTKVGRLGRRRTERTCLALGARAMQGDASPRPFHGARPRRAACSKDGPPAQPARARRTPLASPAWPIRRRRRSVDAAAPAAAVPRRPRRRPPARRRTATSSSSRSTPARRHAVERLPARHRAAADGAREARPSASRSAYSISSYTSMSLGGLLGGTRTRRSSSAAATSSAPTRTTSSSRSSSRGRASTRWASWPTCTSRGRASIRASTTGRSSPGSRSTRTPTATSRRPSPRSSPRSALGDPANDSRRFFFWAHFLDPHDLYQRHEGIDWGKTPRDRYDGEVTFTDQYLGKLLDFIATQSWASRTIIIVTADHGEEFGEHNMTRHGFEVWETLVHVPLMIVAPGAGPATSTCRAAPSISRPTISELFGVPPDSVVRGQVDRRARSTARQASRATSSSTCR